MRKSKMLNVRMQRCRRCGEEVEAREIYCLSCGAQLVGPHWGEYNSTGLVFAVALVGLPILIFSCYSSLEKLWPVFANLNSADVIPDRSKWPLFVGLIGVAFISIVLLFLMDWIERKRRS